MLRPRVSAERNPAIRPRGMPRSYVCPACDFVLYDGVDYIHCPTCGLAVDWIDLARPLWCCATCDAYVNVHRSEWPRCAACDRLMDRVHALEEPPADEPKEPSRLMAIAGGVYMLCGLAQLVVYALDPLGFVVVAPILIALVIAALGFVAAIGFSFGELAVLARDHTTRVIHGFEHACIALAREAGLPVLGGLTHDGHYVVELVNDGRADVPAIRRAAEDGIRRVQAGETKLAYSKQCGTSLLVGLLCVALVIAGGTVVGLAAGLQIGVLALIITLACAAAWLAARPLGLIAQHLLTVSTRFRYAEVLRIVHTTTADGARARFLVSVNVDAAGHAR